MKKTAVQQVFSELETLFPNYFNVYTTEGKEFINHFHKYLDIEKQQIIDTYDFVSSKICTQCDDFKTGEQYYKETFKQQEQ